ncbi:MAG TPA: hypothetical protein PK874_02845 [Desulfobacteraceae bacterium]|nr:hypothetical protein [Desulfobacteraceae bacterium]HPJ68294.1 hypothetical protein [Desulfobacteraceae bacterium]HPQ29607.1 hypothetical protein [Desulfobacteraceae bacterium]
MAVLEKARKTEFMGRDFLLWLWFKSETGDGQFDLGEDGLVEIWFDNMVTLQSESDDRKETIRCSGENCLLKEARFALTREKKITQAMIRLIIEENEWSFVLDSMWFDFRTLKTPKVIQDNRDDPEGLFYEKVLLVEQAVSVINAVFASYIRERLSPEWKSQTLPAMTEWISEGRQ